MAETLKVPAKWTDDCQGKKDYDGRLVSLSTRYWPSGGGFFILERNVNGVRINENPAPDIKPSAKAEISLGSYANDFYGGHEVLAVVEFEAETQEEVQRQVEAWAAEQYARITAALRREFVPPSPTREGRDG